jgi:hypothetical protein
MSPAAPAISFADFEMRNKLSVSINIVVECAMCYHFGDFFMINIQQEATVAGRYPRT